MRCELESYVELAWPTSRWEGVTTVVACSGGPDSTALLAALSQLRPSSSTLVVAHFNHALRGDESDGDQAHVEALANRLGCACYVGKAEPTLDDRTRDEATLRDRRYDFLQRVAGRVGARYVAVGHTADDSVETMLHQLFRGSGLSGLASLPGARDLGTDHVLVRPLVGVWRADIEHYLSQRGLTARLDSSNQEQAYARNRLRHRLLPLVRELYGPTSTAAVHRAAVALREASDWLDAQAARWSAEHIDSLPHGLRIRQSAEHDANWPLVQSALQAAWTDRGWSLQAMTREHWLRIRHALTNAAEVLPEHHLPSSISLQTADGWLTLQKMERR